MKRKGLIISTALIALLAVGCNKGNGGKTKSPWGEFLASAMKEAFGEVLPFVQFNEENVRFRFQTIGSAGLFTILDDNEDNIFDGYSDKLIKKGFEEKEDEEGIYYQKVKNGFYNEVTFDWYPASEDYEAGNELDANYGYDTEEAYIAAHSSSLSFNSVKSFFSERGVKNITLPKYEGESIIKGLAYNPALDTLEYDVYDSSHEEMVAYAESLEAKGWTLETDSYGDYSGYLGQTGAYIAVEDYIGYSYDCIRVYMYVAEPPLPEEEGFPVQHVLHYLYEEGVEEDDLDEDDFAEYPMGESTVFEYDDSMADYFGGCDVYVTGTSSDDCEDYVDTMVEDYGWSLDNVQVDHDDEEDPTLVTATTYTLTFVTGGSYDVFMVAYDYLYTNDYVDLFIGVTLHEEEYDTFPLEEVNAFLEEYELGFSFTAETALPDSAGEGFTVMAAEDDGYHGLIITVSGNQLTSYVAILEPILTAADYELMSDYSSETYKLYCLNGELSSHQVQIAYDSDNSQTRVSIWE